MWVGLPIFDGETEAELKAEFISLSIRYRNNPNVTPLDIAQHIFAKRKEPLRYLQAYELWSKDIEVLDAITNGCQSDENDEIKRFLRECMNDVRQEMKDRLKAADQLAEIEGKKVKAVDIKLSGNSKQPELPIFQFAVRQDDKASSTDTVERASV